MAPDGRVCPGWLAGWLSDTGLQSVGPATQQVCVGKWEPARPAGILKAQCQGPGVCGRLQSATGTVWSVAELHVLPKGRLLTVPVHAGKFICIQTDRRHGRQAETGRTSQCAAVEWRRICGNGVPRRGVLQLIHENPRYRRRAHAV